MTSLRPAHEFLCDQGILHRDVSAGNIMLLAITPPEAGCRGFYLVWPCRHYWGSMGAIAVVLVVLAVVIS